MVQVRKEKKSAVNNSRIRRTKAQTQEEHTKANRETCPAGPPDTQPAEVDLPTKCDKPTKEEIGRVIKQLKNNKAERPDDITAEALETDTDFLVELLYRLFTKIWAKEEVSSDWREGYLIKLPKKGDISNCYRLDYKDMHNTEKKWNPVDTVDLKTWTLPTIWHYICWWLSHSYQQMQTTSEVAVISSRLGLNVHKGKIHVE
ncbi:hypothetical protein NP493_585g01030 [Ridgeia piscesae]|uniref:Uncharacterized protein n=1 Tax=Ridgeia piscesae TaxID=27915 RepID=A0AAD9KVL1_RIDPI|nr:hypothetical protein NP493_585g01030 [Ridgeia piscesae]